MPQPQNYSHPDLTEILSICYEALNYSPHPELYNQAMTDFIGVQPDKQERDPITGENAPKATIPGTVSKITSNIEKLYMDTTQNLGLTDPAAQPFQQPSYDQTGAQQPGPQPPYQQQPQFAAPGVQQPVQDSGSIGWAILGFFIPIVGLILFLVWKNTKPQCAKMAGIGAIVGFCLGLIMNMSFLR